MQRKNSEYGLYTWAFTCYFHLFLIFIIVKLKEIQKEEELITVVYNFGTIWLKHLKWHFKLNLYCLKIILLIYKIILLDIKFSLFCWKKNKEDN